MEENLVKEIEQIAEYIDNFFVEAVKTYCGKTNTCEKCCAECVSHNAHFDYHIMNYDSGIRFDSNPNEQAVRGKKAKQRVEDLFNNLKIKYGWDEKTGFLTPIGCRLPRTERSIFCQQAQCKIIGEHLKDSNWNEFNEKLARLREIRQENDLLI